MTSVYLCAAWQRQAAMRTYRDRLAALGVAVTSSWIDSTGPIPATPQEERTAALMDLGDLARAHEVLAFTEHPSIGYLTGGRHVELGYAIALNKPIWLVGPPENVFHHHPLVSHVDRFEAVLYTYAGRKAGRDAAAAAEGRGWGWI